MLCLAQLSPRLLSLKNYKKKYNNFMQERSFFNFFLFFAWQAKKGQIPNLLWNETETIIVWCFLVWCVKFSRKCISGLFIKRFTYFGVTFVKLYLHSYVIHFLRIFLIIALLGIKSCTIQINGKYFTGQLLWLWIAHL